MRWRKVGLLVTFIISGCLAVFAIWTAVQAEPTIMSVGSSPRWQQPQRVSTTSNFGASTPQIATAPNGDMLLMYSHRVDNVTLGTNPYFRIMPANSSQWSAPQPVQFSPKSLGQGSFAFDTASSPHAIWRTTTGIFHSRRNQWPDNSNTIVSRGRNVYDPVIAIGPDNVIHVVWREADVIPTAGYDIYHAYSIDDGATWPVITSLRGNATTDSPTIAVDSNGDVHVAWEERVTTTNYQIRYKKATKTGGNYSWASDYEVISGALTTARRPLLLAQGTVLHLSFTNRISDNEQYAFYRQRSSAGSWGTINDVTQNKPLTVPTNAPFFLLSDMIICDGSLTLFYHGNPVEGGKEQIFAHINNNGWSARETVTPGEERTVLPSIACRDGVTHVVYAQVVTTYQDTQIYHMFAYETLFLPAIFK